MNGGLLPLKIYDPRLGVLISKLQSLQRLAKVAKSGAWPGESWSVTRTGTLNWSERQKVEGLICVAKASPVQCSLEQFSHLFCCEQKKAEHCQGAAVIDYFLNVRRTRPLSACFQQCQTTISTVIVVDSYKSYLWKQLHIHLANLHSTRDESLQATSFLHLTFTVFSARPGVFSELVAKTPWSYKM